MRAPRSIGDYRVITLIGVGASSSVYRAIRADDDLQVAIKVLADNHSAMAESRRRFTDEWKLLARVDHPSIATIYDAGETDDGQPYMVLELANRGDLRTRVNDLAERGQRIDVADIRAVADHLHDALSALHGEGVVHRDISPSNILIRGDSANGRPPMVLQPSLLEPGECLLLSDLGFAKRLADASGLTRGGGTEGFAAPEQRSAVSIVDQRADLFSATALIRWLAADTLAIGTLAGERFDRFVGTGTADDPDDRHADIETWYRDLDEALLSAAPSLPGVSDWSSAAAAGGSGEHGGSGGLLSRLARPVPGLRRPVGLLAAAGLIGVAVVAALLWPTPTTDTTRTDPEQAADPSSPASSATLSPTASADGSPDSSASSSPTSLPAGSDPSSSVTVPTTASSSAATGPSTSAPDSSASTGSSVGSSTTGASTTSSPTGNNPTTTATSTTATSTTATSTTATSTTATSTTAPSPTTLTTVPTTATSSPSTSNPFPFSPRAYIEGPPAGATVDGALVVSGSLRAPDGGDHVVLVIHHEDSGDYWHDDPGAFQNEFIRFRVEVDRPGAVESNWTYRVDAADLRPGSYRLRVWGRAVDGSGDPVSDIRSVTVSN